MQPWSPAVNVPDGATIQYGSELYQYRGRARDRERRHLFSSDSGLTKDFTDDELIRLAEKLGPDGRPILHWVSKEELRTLKSGKKTDRSSPYEAAETDEKERVDRLLIYVRAWVAAGRPPKTDQGLAPVIAATAAAENIKRVCSSTLRRAIARWDGTIDSLVSRHDLKGNCNAKVDLKVWELHKQFACAGYFVPERPSITAVHELVVADFKAWNLTRPKGTAELKPLGRSSTYDIIRAEGGFIRDYTRIGRRQAMRDYRGIGRAPETLCANDVWEVDASPQPIIALDDDLVPIGRATVMFILDRATRATMGFDLSWRAESLRSFGAAMKMAVTTKEALLASAGIEGTYPMHGMPGIIVSDRAGWSQATTKSKFRLMCERLGIDPANTASKEPYNKGKIERFIQTYFFQVCHVVPGSTFSDIFERSRERPPEKVAVCTLSELRTHILRFIVQIYHPRFHRGLENAPLLAYKDSVGQFGITPPPDMGRLQAILSESYERTVQPYGIEILGMHYHSTDLIVFRQILDRPKTVSAYIDNQDITRGWWVDPRDGEPKKMVMSKPDREKYRGWTLEKWERVRAIRRNNPELLLGDKGAREAHAYLLKEILAKAGSDGMKGRREACRALEKLRKRGKNKFNDDYEEPVDEDGEILDKILDDEDDGPGPNGVADPPPEPGSPQSDEAAVAEQVSPAVAPKPRAQQNRKTAGRPRRRNGDAGPDLPVRAANAEKARSEPVSADRTSAAELPSAAEESVKDHTDSDNLREFAQRLVSNSRKVEG